MTSMHWTIPLPPGYRVADLLAFHGRDTESVAEQVSLDRIRKGVLVDGVPVLLDIALSDSRAECTADADGDGDVSGEIEGILLNILGLRIDPAPFEALAVADPLLAPLLRANPGLRIMQAATPFEALTWAIIGQQINLPFAIALRRTFILQAGRRHSGGLWCYPEAADVVRLDVTQLTERKFSRAKADTLLRLARLVDDGGLSLAAPAAGGMPALCAALLAIKGIGPWTVNYALLRGYGDADCSLHGDVAIRAALQQLLGLDSKPDQAATERWLASYAPQRTMLAAHLWASLQKPSTD